MAYNKPTMNWGIQNDEPNNHRYVIGSKQIKAWQGNNKCWYNDSSASYKTNHNDNNEGSNTQTGKQQPQQFPSCKLDCSPIIKCIFFRREEPGCLKGSKLATNQPSSVQFLKLWMLLEGTTMGTNARYEALSGSSASVMQLLCLYRWWLMTCCIPPSFAAYLIRCRPDKSLEADWSVISLHRAFRSDADRTEPVYPVYPATLFRQLGSNVPCIN